MSKRKNSIIITGAAGAIGKAVTRQVLKAGYIVTAIDRDPDALKVLEAEFQTPALTTQTTDLRDKDAVVTAVSACPKSLSALIHLAGLYQPDTAAQDSWQANIAANLTSAHMTAEAFLAARDKSRQGRIVLFGSIAGEIGSRDHVAYSAAKAGLKGLAHGLAREHAPQVSVNVIAPGMVRSPMGAATIAARGEEMLRGIPAARFAVPEDIAPLALFLCSDAADYITGQTLHVNGGAYMT